MQVGQDIFSQKKGVAKMALLRKRQRETSLKVVTRALLRTGHFLNARGRCPLTPTPYPHCWLRHPCMSEQ